MYELIILNNIVCITSFGLIGDPDHGAGSFLSDVITLKYYVTIVTRDPTEWL